jgi:gamma-tubulin complex component 2
LGYCLTRNRFNENVEAAYAVANTSLLNHLLSTHDLSSRLRSLKHYFFLDQADCFANFLDLSMVELKKPAATVSVSRLQSLMDLCLRLPENSIVNDRFKEDLKVEINETSLMDWLMEVVNVLQYESVDELPATASTVKPEADKNLRGTLM